MTPALRSPVRISAVISDVDGTLVTKEKILTERARKAVAALETSGIAFAIISGRPPRGMRMLFEPLKITTPVTGFNGGAIATPQLSVIEQHFLSREAARRAVGLMASHGIDAWVYGGQQWLVRAPGGAHVGREERTVRFKPVVVDNFGSALDTANKIVGVSDDFDLLTRCEAEACAMLAQEASVSRSQPYYLDITHPLANKGAAVLALSKLLAVPTAEIAVIGDADNDISMFERSGLSIAMGNAAPNVQRAAALVTTSHQEEGFATAIERFILAGERPAGIQRSQIHDRFEDRG